MERFFICSLFIFSSLIQAESLPTWFAAPPSDTSESYFIAANGLTYQNALKESHSLLSQRLLTTVTTSSEQNIHKINNKTVSEFKQKIKTKGLAISLPSPSKLNEYYDEGSMSYFYLFKYNKIDVINLINKQKLDILNSITNILSTVSDHPFQCGVVENKNAKKLQLLKGLLLIESNSNVLNENTSKELFGVFDNCFINRKLALIIPEEYPILKGYIEELLINWNIKLNPNSKNKLIIKIAPKEFERFGQSGIQLNTKVTLSEDEIAVLQVTTKVSGYNPVSTDKATNNAQLKLIKKLKQQLNPLLRNINDL
ncbi:hypothetical protein [uncultured Psychrosphaera sp.]|jgi:hypothetical protein|uniref:hypothetical protein n=1 Tax=uncultured Psychrosphaera sp. TaxID=1403522 RepID=UPI00263985A7|nr:hypothetical protein [uncultured Psychrosphaera sp.]